MNQKCLVLKRGKDCELTHCPRNHHLELENKNSYQFQLEVAAGRMDPSRWVHEDGKEHAECWEEPEYEDNSIIGWR